MTRRLAVRAAALLVAAVVMLAGRGAGAHALNPALLQLEEDETGFVRVTWKVTVSETSVDDISPELPACEEVSPRASTHVGVGVVSTWTARCGHLAGATVGVRGLKNRSEEVLLRVRLADGQRFTTVLRGGGAMFTVPAAPARLTVLGAYARLGVEHIVLGVDHLAFVFGLVILVGFGRRLLGAITAFTVAHSLTLALASLGFVHVPSALVEVLIALSILFVGVEIARPTDRRSVVTARWPWLIAFGFGLLHGFGFAGALAEVGLPAGEIPAALLAFNAGVETGQVAFVACVWAISRAALAVRARWFATRFDPAPLARRASAWAIGASAAFWTLDRLLSLSP
ncbi:MAG: HupE/UreJ family protein [Myxococcales bacterium]|nr:HupE/UreJ family protein [Myxococcales bacterium]